MYIDIHACRRKPLLGEYLTDREIFMSLPLGDTWDDAELYTVWSYLWTSSSLKIPESWAQTMQNFDDEFRLAVVAEPELVAQYNAARLPN